MISKNDVDNWKADPVTKEFFKSCEARVEECKEILANQAGLDPINDNFYRGFITAYREKVDFTFEED